MKLAQLLLFFLFIPFITHAQNRAPSNIDSLAKYLLKYAGSFDKEKILLQTDRRIYTSRETIYFKAFLIDSITNQLRSKPKKLYVDLVNDDDRVLGQLLLNTSNLKTSGEFFLNDSLEEGYYWIRAYTQKMISENLAGITVTPVYVVNPRKRNSDEMWEKKEIMDSPATPLVQVFPEGGNIISGLNSTVALKVTDQHGNPMVVQGILKDNADREYAKFTTNAGGLAKFSFYPIWYHRYAIYLLKKNKYDSVAPLPRINFFASQLAVIEQTDNHITVRIALEDSIYSKDYTTYLFAISGDSICYSAMGKGMYESQIPLNNFSHGIARLVLFNAKKQLLSERDIFIKKENYHISIHTDKENYAPRENVKVDLTVTDKNDKPLLAALAFAVTDTRITDTITDDNMNDTLRNFSAEDADLVMLTCKKKYADLSVADTLTRLETINNPEKTPIRGSSEEKYNDSSFTISGMVVNKKNEPVAKKLVTIFSNKNYVFVNTDITDIKGRFKFYVPDYSDSMKFVVQVGNLKGKKEDEYKIVYDTSRMPHFTTPVYLKTKFTFDEKLKTILNQLYYLDSVQIGTGKEWLKPVLINRRKKKEVDYDETKRVSPFSHIITQKMLNRGANMAGNALLMIPGVHSTGNSIAIGGPVSTQGNPGQPLVVLNGVAMDSASLGANVLDFVNSIPESIIDFIEVLTGPEGAIYGMQGGNGVILINTSSHSRRNETNLTGLSSFYQGGFHTPYPFNMPDYNNKGTKASKMPDLRTTIYWNGDIITDKDGRASFNFFTADMTATYFITITGISANGDKIFKRVTISRK
jgi:hypothetical protein